MKHSLTTIEAHNVVAGDVLPNRGTVMSTEHVCDPEGTALVVMWFRKDGTDAMTTSADDLTSWTEEAHRMVWFCEPVEDEGSHCPITGEWIDADEWREIERDLANA